jgi:hypothetical protein
LPQAAEAEGIKVASQTVDATVRAERNGDG